MILPYVVIVPLVVLNIFMGIRLVIKSRKLTAGYREVNKMLNEAAQLRATYDKHLRTHLIPTPEWYKGWMWN